MALHGSATIELKDADGSKQVIKHDNLITNAPSDLLRSSRGDYSMIFRHMKNADSFARTLFGGILLFGDTLNDDPAEYYIPTSNIVGYASQDAYSGLDLARGSNSESESGLQEDGSYKFVWDFSTAQANGTIKSLALCPNLMGQIGASATQIESELKKFREVNLQSEFLSSNNGYSLYPYNIEGIGNYDYQIVAQVGDIAYAIYRQNLYYESDKASYHFSKNGGILRLYKFKIGAKNISLKNKLGEGYYLGYDEVAMPKEFTDVLHTGGYLSAVTSFDVTRNVLILFPYYKKNNIVTNATTKILEIDIVNGYATTVSTFTNNTPYGIKTGSSNIISPYKYNFFVCKDYVVSCSAAGTGYKFYVTKRSDNTIVKEVKYSDDAEFLESVEYFNLFFYKGNILVFYSIRNNSSNRFYILDMETGIIRKTNAEQLMLYNYNRIPCENDYSIISTGEYTRYYPFMNPFVICTKNNLDSPVTKTSSQTMKITYILSETQEV